MAGETLVRNGAAEIGWIGPVVSRAHRPITTLLGIPAHRQFDQLSFGSPVEISASVISRSDNVLNFHFEDVGMVPVRANLMALLEEFAVALEHSVVAAGSAMIEFVTCLVI